MSDYPNKDFMQALIAELDEEIGKALRKVNAWQAHLERLQQERAQAIETDTMLRSLKVDK